MKVVHIFNEINFSGAELMYLKAAKIFIEKGCELHAVSTGNKEGQIASQFREAGFKVYHFPIPSKTKQLKYFFEFYKFLKSHKFDVIHIHRSAFYWNFAFLAKILKIHCVRTIHSVFKHRWFTRWIGILNRFFARNVLGVKFQSISQSVKENEFKYYLNNTFLIYNWFDDKVFFPINDLNKRNRAKENMGFSSDDFIVITVGRCVKEKRHVDIIKAISHLKHIHNIKFLHLGDGENLECESQLAIDLEVKDRIYFAGNKNNVRDYLIVSDLFVMTSEYEGLPIAGIEAMGCNLPMLVYNSPGLRDIVKNGSNGYICSNDPKDLSDKILELYNNKKLLVEFGKKSYELAMQNYNMTSATNKIFELYLSKPAI